MNGGREVLHEPALDDALPASGVLRRPRNVGIVEQHGVVYLGRLPAGPLVILQGSGSEVWRAAQDAPRESVAARVAEALGVDEAEVAASVDDFVSDLLARGLLETS